MPLFSTRHRRVRTALSAAVLLATLAACSVPVDGTASRAGGAATTAAGTGITQPSAPATAGGTGGTGTTAATQTAAVPAGLETFYGQQLSWGPCASFSTDDSTKKLYAKSTFQCAFLTVPLDYSAPTGSTIKLGVLKVSATGSDRIGSVVMNPGGPGGSGMSAVAQFSGSAAALLRRFDFVGFDPRGVGASVPTIRCATDAERDASRAVVDRTGTPAEIAAADARTEQVANRCFELTTTDEVDGAAFLGKIGTVDVAKDLDVLRAALGDRQLTYLGFSYGTSIGTQYAEQFGKNVRAMILDGAVDPDADTVQDSVNQAAGFQTAFDDFATWCAQQAGCVLGTDEAKSTAVYQQLTRPLLDKPVSLADGRVLSYNDANTGTAAALYSKDYWPYLLQGLLKLSQGDGSVLMALADSYEERDAGGHYANLLEAFSRDQLHGLAATERCGKADPGRANCQGSAVHGQWRSAGRARRICATSGPPSPHWARTFRRSPGWPRCWSSRRPTIPRPRIRPGSIWPRTSVAPCSPTRAPSTRCTCRPASPASTTSATPT